MKKIILLTALILSVSNSFSQITLSVSETSISENETFTITANLDAAKDLDVTIPLTLSGEAVLGKDYTVNFDSKGFETTVFEQDTDFGSQMRVLPNGYLIFLRNNQLRIFNPESNELTEVGLSAFYQNNFEVIDNNTLIGRNSNTIFKINITDLSNIIETPFVELGESISFQQNFSINGDELIYNVYDSNLISNQRKTFKKTGDENPILIYQGNNCCYTPVEINNKIYKFNSNSFFTLKNGESSGFTYLPNNININSIQVNNNEIFALSNENKPVKINIKENEVQLEELPIGNETATINSFTLDPLSGLLYTQNIESFDNINYDRTISSYQLAPQLKILAGETTGEITLVGIDDELFELAETLVLTAGTPTNATFADGINTSLDLEFTDNDQAAVVTFSFSSEAIEENATENVQLIATLDAVSGVDVTVPFTLSGTATITDEYIVVNDATEIIIPAGETSGSIAISTNALDDDEVEIIETILFTIGEITNGTSDTSEVTLNLVSDDDPEITSIVSDITTAEENGQFVITATSSAASAKDVIIPLAFSGDAILEKDFTSNFEGKGEKSLIFDMENNSSGAMKTLPNGKIVFLINSQLTIINPSDNSKVEKNLNEYYEINQGFYNNGNTILYARNGNKLIKIDISDIDNIVETVLVNLENNNSQSFDRPFTFDGQQIIYQVYDNNSNRRVVYRMINENNGELIESYDNCCFSSVFVNNKLLVIDDNYLGELIDGQITNYRNFNNFRINKSKLIFYKGEIYAINTNNNKNRPGKLIITDEQVTFEPIEIAEDETDIQYFDFDKVNGNLITYESNFENNDTNYTVNSYQLSPIIKIVAGQTSGEITLAGIDDELFELAETLVLTAGTPTNATFADGINTSLDLEFTDNDQAAVVTFSFSSEAIEENATENVQLIATLDAVSGVDVTVPFTLSGTATITDEYIVVNDATEIIIPAGETSGSIAISTNALDDDEVEIIETILFTIGEITNGTSDTSEVTLNLVSDDDPEITSIVSDITTAEENGQFVITATSSAASAKDVIIPLAFSGDAILEKDFTSNFEGKGEKSLIFDMENNSYGDMAILPDGKIVFLENHELRVYDPTTDILEEKTNLSYYYENGNRTNLIAKSQTILYARSNEGYIVEIDISDIDSITETVYLNPGNNISVDNFNFTDNRLYYSVYNNTLSSHALFKKIGDENPEQIFSDGGYYTVYENNGKVYAFEYWDSYEIIDGQRVRINKPNNSQIQRESITIFNGEMYGLVRLNQQGSYTLQKIIINDSQITFESLPLNGEPTIIFFNFNPVSGNLITSESNFENGNNSYTINSYQLLPQLKIPAGETTGEINLVGIDDELFELDENIVLNIQNAINATYANSLLDDEQKLTPITLTITDNDELPNVTFEFSSETIEENSDNIVTLTATSVSGAEIKIPFTLSGTATITDEYKIVNDVTEIIIPANENSASISITTIGLDDDEVEVQESIIFNLENIINASSDVTNITLNLVSDDDPNITGVTASKLIFAEHETSVITATIDNAASKDVTIQLSFDGTATRPLDYSVDYATKGEEFLLQELEQNFEFFDYLPDGRLLTFMGNVLHILQLNGTIDTFYLYDLGVNAHVNYTVRNDFNLYFQTHSQIVVFNTNTNEISLDITNNLSGTGESYNGKPSIYNDKLFYLKRDNNGIISFLSKLPGEEEEVIWQKNGWPFDGFEGVIVKENEDIYFYRNDGIYRVDDSLNEEYEKLEVLNNYGSFNLNNLKLINNNLYGRIRNYSTNTTKIIRFDDALENYTVLDYNLGENITSINNFTFTPNGQLAILSNISGGKSVINGYKAIPEITILAGQTSGSLEINGLEDNLNSPGEEEDETIELSFFTPINASLTEGNELEGISLTLLNNEITLTEDIEALANVPPLSSSSVAWGDFDRDGDQDMAIMGVGLEEGVVTRLYENVEGIFTDTNQSAFDPRYEGDLIWVDFNKDGYIDLIVSGLDANNEPSTSIYENINGDFAESTELSLPNLFQTSMDSGDLDNDGDIDFVINGIQIENGINVWKKYIYLREGSELVLEEDFNDQFREEGVVNGKVKIADSNFDGDLDVFMIGKNNSKIQNNTYVKMQIPENWDYWQYQDFLNNSNYIRNLDNSSIAFFGNYMYYMGKTDDNQSSTNSIKIYRKALNNSFNYYNYDEELSSVEGLINGSIAIADYNNDGMIDLVVTGENENAESVTKLYDGTKQFNQENGFVENTEKLREASEIF